MRNYYVTARGIKQPLLHLYICACSQQNILDTLVFVYLLGSPLN